MTEATGPGAERRPRVSNADAPADLGGRAAGDEEERIPERRIRFARETIGALERVRAEPTPATIAAFHELHASHLRELGDEAAAARADERADHVRRHAAGRPDPASGAVPGDAPPAPTPAHERPAGASRIQDALTGSKRGAAALQRAEEGSDRIDAYEARAKAGAERSAAARRRMVAANARAAANVQRSPLRECDEPADERDHAADERDHAADERDHAADERELAADKREQIADERDARADLRDKIADRRERRKRFGRA